MKYFFFFLFFVFILTGCGPEKTVRVKGILSGADAEMIYLRKLSGNEQVAVADSARLDANGSFSFKYKISQPTFYSLTVNNKSITLLVEPGEKVAITGDVRLLTATYDLDGSGESKNIRRLAQRLDHTVFVGDSLDKTLQQFSNSRNYVNIQRQLEWNYLNEIDSLREYNIRFIKENTQSLAVIYALYQQIQPGIFLFNREEDIKYFRMADSLFYKRFPNVSHVKSLHANVMEMNEKYRIMELNRKLSMLGYYAPEIALPSPDGQVIKLSDHKGKYILLDFWASWSAPCRKENHNLVETYNKYRNKGFDIFQVSLDQSKSSWERAIKEDGLAWMHVSDFQFWNSDIVKQYGIEAIPANFLIDKDGMIIGKELRGEALDKKLSELFTATE